MITSFLRRIALITSGPFVVCIPALASNITYDYTLTGTGYNAGVVSGSGTITVSTTSNPDVDVVTGITGSYAGGYFSGTVSGLISGTGTLTAPPAPYTLSNYSSDAYTLWDNLLYPNSSSVSYDAGYYQDVTQALFDGTGIDFSVSVPGSSDTYEVNIAGGYYPSVGADSYVVTALDTTTFTETFDEDYGPVAFTITSTDSNVPEPGSLWLLGTGVLGAGMATHRGVKRRATTMIRP